MTKLEYSAKAKSITAVRTQRELTAGVHTSPSIGSEIADESWSTEFVKDHLVVEMDRGPIVHHRTTREELNFHDLQAGLYLGRMAIPSDKTNVKFTVSAIDFTPKLRQELIEARKFSALGPIMEDGIRRWLRSFDELKFIENAKNRPLKWEIISLDL